MKRRDNVARWFLAMVGSVLPQGLVQVQVADPVLDLPCRRHYFQNWPPAKSADQFVDQLFDVSHGVRLPRPDKTHLPARVFPRRGRWSVVLSREGRQSGRWPRPYVKAIAVYAAQIWLLMACQQLVTHLT